MEILTILFTQNCPLDCTYCAVAKDQTFCHSINLSDNEVMGIVENFVNKIGNQDGHLVLTGGEPFLYPDLIKKIISRWGTRLSYEFNTSGLLITKEMLDFLSDYEVAFNLSVDGGKHFADWRRPLKSDNAGVGFYDKVKEIFPYLLYYFPETPWKMIIPRRCIDLVRDCYLEAEGLGFKSINYVIDLNERPSIGISKNLSGDGTKWSEEDFGELEKQMMLIADEILFGFEKRRERAMVMGIDIALTGMLSPEFLLNRNSTRCNVINGAANISTDKNETKCMHEVKNLQEWYDKKPLKCPKNESCLFWAGCFFNSCLKDNFDYSRDIFNIEPTHCHFTRAYGMAAYKILSVGNKVFQDNEFYRKFLSRYVREG